MTPEEVKKILPVFTAFAEGKPIQYSIDGSKWVDFRQATFSDPANCYRIKPEPKLRPWKAEEVPVGALYRTKADTKLVSTILGAARSCDFPIRFCCWLDGKITGDGFSVALASREHSTDQGKTWHPCGVEESE